MTRRARRALALSACLLLGSLLLHLTAPATVAPDGDLILDRAARWSGAAAPGESAPSFPASTVWIAAPLSLAMRAAARIAGEPAGVHVARTLESWRGVLRGIFCLLGGLLVLQGLDLIRAGRASPWDRDRAPAGGASPAGMTARSPAGRSRLPGSLLPWCAWAAVMPAIALAAGHLLPALPAASLAFVLLQAVAVPGDREGPSRAARLRAVVSGGLLLAWFAFLWPVVVVALALLLPRPRGGRAAAMLAAGMVLLALAVRPGYLVHPGAALPSIVADWRREGGWGGSGRGVALSLLGLTTAWGPLGWALLAGVCAWTAQRRALSPAVPLALLWVIAALLPAVSGAGRPGSVQWALAPVLVAWSLATIEGGRGRPRLVALALALAAVVSVLPARVDLYRQARAAEELLQRVRREVASRVAPGELLLSEVELLPTVSAGETAGLPGLFLLPRDSRQPDRYDFGYWPRWYAGYRWVLLSSARVREAVERPGARLPRALYAAIEHDGTLVREWGDAVRGYRLYRVRDGSAWTRPLADAELGAFPGGEGMAWFVGRLASSYTEAGEPRRAEQILRAGLRWEPSAPGLHNNLGAVYLRLGDFAAAATAFEAGLARAPDSFELVWNFGLACSGAKLWARAETLFRRAAAIRPDYAPVHYELARAFIGQDKAALAREALERYLELDPATARRGEIEAVLARLRGVD